jgi:hypothetical protein
LTHWLTGGATALIGLGLVIPALTGWQEQGAMSWLGWTMLVPGGLLLAWGCGAVVRGVRRPPARSIPASVLGAIVVNALFLGLFALEISTGVAREGGVVARSLFLFPPALVLFWGLLTGRRWAWRVARWGSLGFALLYFGVSILVCVLRPSDQHGPVWVWIASVGVVLGMLLLVGGFHALGRPSARRHFGVMPAATESPVTLSR